MKNRIVRQVQAAHQKKKKLFCAFLTLGFPSLGVTEKLILEFEKAGVDIIELGFPFSDPMADGPTIQYSSEQALKKGVRLEHAFRMAETVRKKGLKIPLIFFTYFNPVFHYGAEKFASRIKRAGFDGVIIPDLPPEEEAGFAKACRKQGIFQIFLMAPTTSSARAGALARHSQGFIYYVSLKGVTGARQSLPQDFKKDFGRMQKSANGKPLLIGFGVSSPEQARRYSAAGDGVIVGSAIVEAIRRAKGRTAPVLSFVKKMVRSAGA